MARSILLLVLGALAGAAFAVWLAQAGRAVLDDPPVRNRVDEFDMSIAEAESHRRNAYASIRSMDEVLALPTKFAEKEALYVVAGRSSSGDLQYLLSQANQLQDRNERVAAQKILLSRLAEIDPRSALAIVRSPGFANEPALRDQVWSVWAGQSFSDAIMAAAELDGAERRDAAESLYLAVGLESDEADWISDQLGVVPGMRVQRRYMLQLAGSSIADAVRYLDHMVTTNATYKLIADLARHAAVLSDSERRSALAAFSNRSQRSSFERQLAVERAMNDPELALREALQDTRAGNHANRSVIGTAMSVLAQNDLDLALSYVDQIGNPQARSSALSSIAYAMAQQDPDAALAWVREHSLQHDPNTMSSVIGAIARKDPARALQEALEYGDPRRGNHLIASVTSQLVEADPYQARDLVMGITDPTLRTQYMQRLGSAWIESDREAAMAWAQTLSEEERNVVLPSILNQLVHQDVDAAIATMRLLPENSQRQFRADVARQLLEQKSLAAAEAYIARHEGEEDHPTMRAAIVASMTHRDPAFAQQQINSVADPLMRDQLRAGLAPRLFTTDRRQALQMLSGIDDPSSRVQAISEIAVVFQGTDPAGASAWIESLPTSQDRDRAIAAIATREGVSKEQMEEYVARIEDEEIRSRAQLSFAYQMVHTDRQAALDYLDSIDMTDEQRDRYRRNFMRMNRATSVRYW